MDETIFETRDLCHVYANSKKLSLDHVDMTINKDRKTVLLGANGAGKSTLFHLFNGVLKPKSGSVIYNGEPLEYSKKALRELRSDVAVVLQNPDDQIFSATVEEDIAFGPLNLGLPRDEVESRVNDALFKVGLSDLRSKPTQQLSFGQKKRAAFAGAIAMEPKVLILDEPTAGLDPQISQEVMELAEQLHHSGTTVIISTHDVNLAYAWADEIRVLRGGKLVYSGDSEGFYSDSVQVHLSGLMPPSMYEINRGLERMNGSGIELYPRTMTQLISKMTPSDRKTGKITIIPFSKASSLNRPLSDGSELVGLYGTDSRKMAYKNGLHVDFVFNGVENCILESMMGSDTVLLCDDEMVDLAVSKIRMLKLFGSELFSTTV